MIVRCPEMIYGGIGIQIREPVAFSVVAVHVRVANVVILFRAELGFDPIEVVLQHGECDGDAVFHPHALLLADRPIGAAPDDVSQLQSFPHPRHGDAARRVAGLERPVYVETDEPCQTSVLSRIYRA